MRLEIANARLVDPVTGEREGSLYVADGRIAAVGAAPVGFRADRVLDMRGCVVVPGLVDIAVRLREPGLEYKATLESELAAAIAGGVTSLACPPDTDPPLDEPGLVEMLKHRARMLHLAHVYPVGALTAGLEGTALTQMGELTEAGCVAFSHADVALADTDLLRRAMQYAATFGYALWLRPNDPYLGRNGVAHDGDVATRLGLPGIPVTAETIALATILTLARECDVRLHVCRVSCARSVAMLREAKADGMAVSCDVAVHHLHLCDGDIGWFDANTRVVPPLRSSADRAALRAALADGTIDIVCSDHAPVDDDSKQLPFGEAEPGVTGVELLLPLTLRWAAEDGVALPTALARITRAPAQLLGIAASLAPGAPADLCVFDAQAAWTVGRDTLTSQGKNTPFLGVDLAGRVRCTLVDGEIVHET
ncbi:MAG: dihydroorotase [Burkholderiales bacterium]|nr:dihydroorotase [Burkholderiales bacterium]